jgi:SAM-dependent methyltransferase
MIRSKINQNKSSQYLLLYWQNVSFWESTSGMSDSYKDHFSGHATVYQKFRPNYPDELFDYLASQAPQRETAWDCATGNGQAAVSLSRRFNQVIATDASDIPDQTIDLITVAQALHWFSTELFFEEAKRVLKPRGIIAVWCYKMLKIAAEVDAVVNHLYHDIVGSYWPVERKFVDNDYADIVFPFSQRASPVFTMSAQWNLAALRGYLSTWSAVRLYMKVHGVDPLTLIDKPLIKAWGDIDTIRQVTWRLRPKLGVND